MANNTNQATYQHQRRTLILICLGFFFSIILLYKVLNPIIILTCLGIIAIRYAEVKRLIKDHPLFLNNILSVFIIFAIIALLVINGFRNYLVNAFINLLVASIALKFLECKQERDLTIQVIALFFLTSLTFVFSFDWYMLFYMILCMIIDYAALMSLFACRRIYELFKFSLKTTLLAIPLAVILFMVLPRFNPFWQMPNASQAKTGLGEEVSFASVEELIKDNSLAFRAVFDGPIPQERYFKTMVYPQIDPMVPGFFFPKGLWEYERNLTPFSKQPLKERPSFERNMGVVYTIYMEPSNRRWIPVLDLSTSRNENIFYSPFSVWLDKFLITQPKSYEFKYLTEDYFYNRSIPLSDSARELLLDTGFERANPQTRAFVENIKKETDGDPHKIVEAFLNYFRDQEFTYTLRPLQFDHSKGNYYDQFLFNNRSGFCNHYAASLTFMLRVAGIPAMTVGGYLGGEVVANENYVIVRNSDAHSWVSAYIDNNWKLIDPVSVIEPSRILDAFANISTPTLNNTTQARVYQNSVVTWFRNILETISFKWNMTILNYNFDDQSGFISRFFKEKTILAAICLILSMVVIIYLSLRMAKLFSKKEIINKATNRYYQYVDLFKDLGLTKRLYETPLQFRDLVLKIFGDHELYQKFNIATNIIVEHLYAETLSEKEADQMLAKNLKDFKHTVNEYKKSKKEHRVKLK